MERTLKYIINIFLIVMHCALLRGQYDFIADKTEGCDTVYVNFEFVSSATVDTISSINWDFGNGRASDSRTPDSVGYFRPGNYTVQLILNGDTDNPIIKTEFIIVHHTVQAIFENEQIGPRAMEFRHIDDEFDSTATYSFNWTFSDGEIFTDREITKGFADTGTYGVVLTVSDNYGCTDTRAGRIQLYDEIPIQNVFTPNGDNINEEFIINPVFQCILSIKIYSRWGQLVYQMEAPRIVWDGKTNNGIEMNSGVYYYVLEALDGDPGNLYTKSGFIHLYKELPSGR